MTRLAMLGLLVVGCDQPPTAADRLAKELNPSLLAMRTSAETVVQDLALTETSKDHYVDACLGNEQELATLRDTDFMSVSRELHMEMPFDADYLLRGAERRVFCQPEHRNWARCARWCAVTWTQLVIDVERLRNASGGDASPIVSLVRTTHDKVRAFHPEPATQEETAR